jgi:hypothetical protein
VVVERPLVAVTPALLQTEIWGQVLKQLVPMCVTYIDGKVSKSMVHVSIIGCLIVMLDDTNVVNVSELPKEKSKVCNMRKG